MSSSTDACARKLFWGEDVGLDGDGLRRCLANTLTLQESAKKRRDISFLEVALFDLRKGAPSDQRASNMWWDEEFRFNLSSFAEPILLGISIDSWPLDIE